MSHHSIWVHLNGILIRMTDSSVMWLLLPKSSDVHSKVLSVPFLCHLAFFFLFYLFIFFKQGQRSVPFTWSNRCWGYCSPQFPWDFVNKLFEIHSQTSPGEAHTAEQRSCKLYWDSRAERDICNLKWEMAQLECKRYMYRGVFFTTPWDLLALMTLIIARKER